MRSWVLLSIFLSSTLSALPLREPWGNGRSLLKSCERDCCEIQNNSLQDLILFHQEIISPVDGERSHFLPTSSHYMQDAVAKYGIWQGWLMGMDRLMRENSDPWIYPTTLRGENLVKSDPVQ